MTKQHADKSSVVSYLLDKLKRENALWSYDTSGIHTADIQDNQLIALTMRHLDIPEIDMLFKAFPFKKIKDVWKETLVPEGDYLYTLNRFFAWFYFKAKKPDAYLKSLITRHINSTMQ